MKGYVVCMWEKINSEEKLKEYALKATSAAEKYSGKFLIRGGKNRTNEGIDSPRTTVLEFPNYQYSDRILRFPRISGSARRY